MPEVDARTDGQTVSAKTFNTWATNWTECTNVTFNKVHRFGNSNSAAHREILAVLAAVTEVIKQEGGNENETEYFGALMTAISTAENEDSITAIAYLLSLVIKRVPVDVLRSKFSTVAKQILDVLVTYSDSNSTSLLKSLLLCLASVLRVPDLAEWSNSSTQQLFSSLLTFIVHKKPKVRKTAHQAVKIVLIAGECKDRDDPTSQHPAASLAAKFCRQQIEECGGTKEAADTLHVMVLLKEIMSEFTQSSIKATCETILKVMTISNLMVRSCGLQTLHGLFSSQPSMSRLPPALNAQIITALYDYQPSESDSNLMRAWLAVMGQAYVNLHRFDDRLCLSLLPRLISACMMCLRSEKKELCSTTSAALEMLLKNCVEGCDKIMADLVKSGGEGSPVHKMLRALEGGLSYQYHASWGLVLKVWRIVFQAFGQVCYPLLKKCLLSMADLRETPHFAFKEDLDRALGSAVQALGPRLFLDAVPLQISGDGDDPNFPRSWLIPVLRDNICNTELAFFSAYFLPLAAKFRERAESSESTVTAKSYRALQMQIWSLLPGFCKNPTDLAKSFKTVAKAFGSAIADRPDLRIKVMTSLRFLVAKNVDNEPNRKELARFAKNYLPILFNLFTSDSDKSEKLQVLAVLETIRTYLKICDQELVLSLFDKCMLRVTDEESSHAKWLTLIDLLVAILPYVDASRLEKMFDLAVPHLESKDRQLQKRAYRVLKVICSGTSQASAEFATDKLEKIQDLLLTSLSNSSPSSKAPRLMCLICVLRQLDTPHTSFLQAIVPEAILCTREVALKARALSYELLVTMAQTVVRWNPQQSEQESIGSFMKMLLAGLAGSPQLITGTLLALTRLLYTHKETVSSDLLDKLVDDVCLLLTSKNRDIVKSGLGFIKVLIGAYNDGRLSGQLKTLVTSLGNMKEDCRHNSHIKVKAIYNKLLKKFGYELIMGMSPTSVHRLLNHIRKEQMRSKKKSQAENVEDDEEEDDDDDVPRSKPENVEDLLRDTDSEREEEEEERKKKKLDRKKKGKGAWLKDGDEIVDFLDPSAAKKVLATMPVKKGEKAKKDSDFKLSADGRLILTGGVHDEGDKMDSEAEDDLDDLLAAFEGPQGRPRKAPKRKLEDYSDDDDEDKPRSSSSYKAGGSGIHRNLSKTQPKKRFGQEYKAKKAGGDIKKGKHDPYAYVPLQRNMLNKRKKAKLQGQFSGLVKGAKKGAAKGAKNRNKQR